LIPVSVFIMTKDEQRDLPGCLDSVAWCDDVHVFDSMSTDDTIAIAERFGATVTRRVFDDESTHQNWGLRNIGFRYPWVFKLDADERMTPELIEAVGQAVQAPGAAVAFRVARRDYLFGTWLKHVVPSPFNIRLFRPERMRFERIINPAPIPDGPVGELDAYFVHYPFSKGISHWLDRHNRYSSMEAEQILINRHLRKGFSIRLAFTATDINLRRYHQKELFYRLPLRPLAKFVLLYLFKRGFLDGRAGLQYAILQTIYEYMIVVKVQEIRRREIAR
jgi:glycosyltransferase involved in cell wall biosynthesis